MDWLTSENLIAVVTALIGVLVSIGVAWYQWWVPRQRRIGYRIQLDTAIGSAANGAAAGTGAAVRRGYFDASPGLEDATLVLLRIENDGALSVTADHYTDGDDHGLTVEFAGRHVKAVVVTAPDHPRLLSHFPDTWTGPAEGATSVLLPKVPLNRGAYYKLLVLLGGGPIGGEVTVDGSLAEGRVHPNSSVTPDDKLPVFSRAALSVTVVLTACVVALAALVVREETPPPIGCARGTLTVTGSTAFAPVVRELAKKYEKDCAGSTVVVDAHGSTAGIRELAAAGEKASKKKASGEGASGEKGAPAVVALSDGRKPGGYPKLRESMVAVSLFTLVVHDDVPVRDLSRDQLRRIYRGDITDWSEVGGPRLPILLVSRDANSGTREVFQRRVLGRNEPAHSSRDCAHRDDPESKVTRCELDSTEQVLATVARLPGALGYTELRAGSTLEGLRRVAIDGRSANVDELGASGYPYREIEYAYTWGEPPADSLTSSFLTYLTRGSGQDVVRVHGHLPCATPKGLRICGDG
ncbi:MULTISPECIES: substrate-binding domain-containing protein [unclassified Streptomyces]|uniref:substrate-binding domain-containing protein n=1 Tax=unclassified Streptomyces TaxID=2593676 RepID=UPI0006AFC080|nr:MULTISPECIES: substrate-binding domain-containing protein [unclassified Streptomyces]